MSILMRGPKAVMIFLSAAVFITSGLAPNNVLGSTKNLEQIVLGPLSGTNVYVAKDKRVKVAKAMLAYWEHFADRIPKLSPREKIWLNSEMEALNVERQNAALNSREFALQKVSFHIDNCLGSLRKLNSLSEVNAEYEMYFWVGTANCYLDIDYLQTRLRVAGLSNGKHNGSFSTQLSAIIRDAVINRLVISAMIDTMNWSHANTSSNAPD